MSRNDDTVPAFSISEDSRVKLPLKLAIALIGVVAAGAIAWGFTTRTTQDNTKRIDSLEQEQRTTREVLIRIDERTAEIKRRLDQGK